MRASGCALHTTLTTEAQWLLLSLDGRRAELIWVGGGLAGGRASDHHGWSCWDRLWRGGEVRAPGCVRTDGQPASCSSHAPTRTD